MKLLVLKNWSVPKQKRKEKENEDRLSLAGIFLHTSKPLESIVLNKKYASWRKFHWKCCNFKSTCKMQFWRFQEMLWKKYKNNKIIIKIKFLKRYYKIILDIEIYIITNYYFICNVHLTMNIFNFALLLFLKELQFWKFWIQLFSRFTYIIGLPW